MYGESSFAAGLFAGALFDSTPSRASGGGIGGGGMSDAEYERLLRSLGAPTARDKIEEDEILALLALGVL